MTKQQTKWQCLMIKIRQIPQKWGRAFCYPQKFMELALFRCKILKSAGIAQYFKGFEI